MSDVMSWERVTTRYARIALGASFLAQMATRAGIWGRHLGADGWRSFVAYTGEVNAFMPRATIPFLAIAATVAEGTLGMALVLGIRPRATAYATAALLALFGIAMTISLGLKEALDYSVFSASAGALLLARAMPARPRVTMAGVLVALGTFALAPRAEAQHAPATVQAQALYGAGFDDAVYGLDTRDGHLRTLLLDADAPWDHGQNLFFLRTFTGPFVDENGVTTGQRVLMYAEATTRVSFLSPARRLESSHLLRDVFLAGGINRGSTGFRANLFGAGVKLSPGPLFLISSLYYRNAPGGRAGIKERTSWALPIATGPLAWSFDGSIDLVTRTSTGTDVSAMPALTLDVGRLAGMPHGTLALGTEWFFHRTRGARLAAPQGTVRWVF